MITNEERIKEKQMRICERELSIALASINQCMKYVVLAGEKTSYMRSPEVFEIYIKGMKENVDSAMSRITFALGELRHDIKLHKTRRRV